MEQKRIFGKVFFPENPNVKAEAWLTLSSEAIIIESSIGAVTDEIYPLILGEFNGMDKVTFVKCYPRGGMMIGAASYNKFRASFCISGKHFYTIQDLSFKRISLSSPALEEWIFPKKYIEELEDNKYQIPKYDEVVKVNIDSIALSIGNGYSIHDTGFELHATRICWVILQSDASLLLDAYSELWRHLKKLILFLTNKNPEFERINLYDEKGDSFELINVKDVIKDNRFSQAINITYKTIESNFQHIIELWFSNKRLHAVIDLVIEKLLNVELSTQGYFLNVCVALETFHEKFGQHDKAAIQNRLQNRKQIIELIENPELLAWFKEESNYWKNPTLKERLLSFKPTIKAIMGETFKILDCESLISKVVKTRNDMAHNGEYLKQFTYIELFMATKIIEYTLRLEILKTLGVNVEQVNGGHSLLMEAHGGIRTLARLNKYENFMEDIFNATAVLFEDIDNFPSPVGSCLFLELGDQGHFVISASHLWDNRNNLFLILFDEELQLGGNLKRTSLPESKNRKHDKLDFAYMKISAEQAESVKRRIQFLTTDDLEISHELNSQRYDYLILGHRAKEPSFRMKMDKHIKTKSFALWTFPMDLNFYEEQGLSPAQNMLFKFDKKNVTNTKTNQSQKAPVIEGISGCGVWAIEKSTLEKKLVGIVTETEQQPGDKFLVATRIDVLTETLNHIEGISLPKSHMIKTNPTVDNQP